MLEQLTKTSLLLRLYQVKVKRSKGTANLPNDSTGGCNLKLQKELVQLISSACIRIQVSRCIYRRKPSNLVLFSRVFI